MHVHQIFKNSLLSLTQIANEKKIKTYSNNFRWFFFKRIHTNSTTALIAFNLMVIFFPTICWNVYYKVLNWLKIDRLKGNPWRNCTFFWQLNYTVENWCSGCCREKINSKNWEIYDFFRSEHIYNMFIGCKKCQVWLMFQLIYRIYDFLKEFFPFIIHLWLLIWFPKCLMGDFFDLSLAVHFTNCNYPQMPQTLFC